MNTTIPTPAPARKKSPQGKGKGQTASKKKKKKPYNPRTKPAWIVAGISAVIFTIMGGLTIEARHKNFYGEPLFQKMAALASIHIHGLPEAPEARARVKSGIPTLSLLPPEAVLPAEQAARFQRMGIQFAYVTQDVRPGGGRYLCRATDVGLVPRVAWVIAESLAYIPEDVVRNMRLETIMFCGDIMIDRAKSGGFPIPQNDMMMLNLTNRTDPLRIKRFFMHEFYHLYEQRFGHVYDPEWTKMFGNNYLESRAGRMEWSHSQFGSGKWGFLNSYSQTYPPEDRAEIFSALTVTRESFLQYVIQAQDEMLYAKAHYIAKRARAELKMQIPEF